MATHSANRVPGESMVAGRRPHHDRPGTATQPRSAAPAAWTPAPWGDDAPADGAAPTVGVLALQGDVLEHLRMLADVGAHPVLVKTPAELATVDALLLPGGESTTIGRLLDLFGLADPIRARLAEGMPAFGTCAGAIVLSRAATLHDHTPSDQPLLGALDAVTRRNAFGRQVASFETELRIAGLGDEPVAAAFIRAPWFEDLGSAVEPLATVATEAGDKIVVVRQGHILASAFHPELTGDSRLHAAFVAMVRRREPEDEPVEPED